MYHVRSLMFSEEDECFIRMISKRQVAKRQN